MAGNDEIDSLQFARDDGTIHIVTVDKTPLFTEFKRDLNTGEAVMLAYAI